MFHFSSFFVKKHITFLILGLLILNFLIFLVPLEMKGVVFRPQNQVGEFPVEKLDISTCEWGVYGNFTDTGEFVDWFDDGNDIYFSVFTDTGNQLYLKGVDNPIGDEYYLALRDFTNDVSTDYLQNITLSYKFHYHCTTTLGDMRVFLVAYFTDSTTQTLKTQFWHMMSVGDYYLEEEITVILTSDKIIDSIGIIIDTLVIATGGYGEIWLYDEIYEGYLPKAYNINYTPLMFKVGDSVLISCENDVYSVLLDGTKVDLVINLVYLSTGYSHTLNMSKLWVDGVTYVRNYTFERSGNYWFFISTYLDYWSDGITDSIIYSFTVYEDDDVIYPAYGKLTLWEPTGLSIPTNLKTYLGNSESYDLFAPEININPEWEPYTGNISGRYVSYYVEDNKLYLDCIRNGVKINCSDDDGLYPNITYYESLVFDVRVNSINTTGLQYIVIGINQWSADYYLAFDTIYLNQWVQYIIPFPRFTWRITNDALGELCFYGHFNAEFKNVFVADYKNLSTILEGASNQTIDSEPSNEWNSSLVIYSGNTTQSSAGGWSNSSTYLEETNFNITQHFTTGNVTIVNNETLQLNTTGNFMAEYSMDDDIIGENPLGFNCTEPTNTNISVSGFLDNHNKFISIFDNSATTSSSLEQYFTSQISGTIELWIRSEIDIDGYQILFYQSATYAIYLLAYPLVGKLYYYDGVLKEICDYSKDVWYHLEIIFDCSIDTFDIWVNGVQEKTGCAFKNGVNVLNKIYVVTGASSSGSNYYSYLDALDYSWSDGYFRNRNYNNTYFQTGYYLSPYYDLNVSTGVWYYESLNFSCIINTDTGLSVQYRYSSDNITFSDWTNPVITNQSINANKQRYFQFCVNFTTTGNNTHSAQCQFMNLTYQICNFTSFYNECILVQNFSKGVYWRGVELTVQLSLNISVSVLINSSIQVWNYTSCEFDTESTFLSYQSGNLSTDYYNSSNHVKIRLEVYSNVAFHYNFTRSDLNVSNYEFFKVCYLTGNISSYGDSWNISIFQISFNGSVYDGNSQIELYFIFTNGTSKLNSTYNDGDNISDMLYVPYTGDISAYQWKFILDSDGNNVSINAYIWKFWMVGALSYRLISVENRQGKDGDDALIFDSSYECLCLTDYYGNVIYKEWINRTSNGYFVDVMLNFWLITFSNINLNELITFNITNRNLNISITLGYGESVSIGLFTDDYVIVAYYEISKVIINTWDVVISKSKNRQYKAELPIPTTNPPYASGFHEFLGENWSDLLFFGIITIGLIYAIRKKPETKVYKITQTEKKMIKIPIKEQKKFKGV